MTKEINSEYPNIFLLFSKRNTSDKDFKEFIKFLLNERAYIESKDNKAYIDDFLNHHKNIPKYIDEYLNKVRHQHFMDSVSITQIAERMKNRT